MRKGSWDDPQRLHPPGLSGGRPAEELRVSGPRCSSSSRDFELRRDHQTRPLARFVPTTSTDPKSMQNFAAREMTVVFIRATSILSDSKVQFGPTNTECAPVILDFFHLSVGCAPSAWRLADSPRSQIALPACFWQPTLQKYADQAGAGLIIDQPVAGDDASRAGHEKTARQ